MGIDKEGCNYVILGNGLQEQFQVLLIIKEWEQL